MQVCWLRNQLQCKFIRLASNGLLDKYSIYLFFEQQQQPTSQSTYYKCISNLYRKNFLCEKLRMIKARYFDMIPGKLQLIWTNQYRPLWCTVLEFYIEIKSISIDTATSEIEKRREPFYAINVWLLELLCAFSGIKNWNYCRCINHHSFCSNKLIDRNTFLSVYVKVVQKYSCNRVFWRRGGYLWYPSNFI